MGHDVVYCDKCHTPIMEGRNSWECDSCNLICDASTGYAWKNKSETQAKKEEIAKQKTDRLINNSK